MMIILLSRSALFLLLPENIQAQVTVKPGIYLLPDIKMKMDSIRERGYVLCGRERQYSRITENE